MTSPLRIGVIGAGNFGEKHLAAYARRADIEIVGVVDRSAERARVAANRWGIPHSFTETEDFLRFCQPQGVSVVTAGADHLEPTLAALAEGCSVLLEKPIALSSADARELVAAEESSSGFVMPAHILRFAAPYQELAARVSNGDIGRVLGVATLRDRGRDHETLFPDVHPAFMTTIHDIDLALWITRTRALRVSARGRGRGETPLLVWAHVEAADESIWELRISWLLSNDAPSSDRLEVYGTDGVVKLELRPTVALFAADAVWIDHELTPDAHAGALDNEIDHFCARLRSPSLEPVVTLADGLHGVEIAEAIVRSVSAGGSPVEVGG